MNGRFLGANGRAGKAGKIEEGQRETGPGGGLALDLFCRAQAVLAAVLAGVAVALLLALAPGVEGPRLAVFGLSALFILWVALLAAAALCLMRRLLAGLSPPEVALAALLVLQGAALLVGVASHALLSGPGEGLWAFLLRISAIAWVVGGLGLLAFAAHYRAHCQALRAKDAELEALHARMRPHFLFNTLNAIASLIPVRPEDAERMVEELAQMLRAALQGPRLVPLAEELALVRAYLGIESLRLEGRLRVVWELPEPLPAVAVPSLSIQPLVENAVRYGVEPAREGGTVEIVVQALQDKVQIIVRNSLPSMAQAGDVAEGFGMALENVRARLDALLGASGGLEVEQGEGVFEVWVSAPLRGIEA